MLPLSFTPHTTSCFTPTQFLHVELAHQRSVCRRCSLHKQKKAHQLVRIFLICTPLPAWDLYAPSHLFFYIVHSVALFCSFVRIQPVYLLIACKPASHRKQNDVRQFLLLRCVVRTFWSILIASKKPTCTASFSLRHCASHFWSSSHTQLAHLKSVCTRPKQQKQSRLRHPVRTSSSARTHKTFYRKYALWTLS